MKRIILCMFLSFFISTLIGVVSDYSFNSSVGTYSEISEGTVHGDATNTTAVFNAVPLGFNFNYNGTVYTQVSIATKGFIGFGPTVLNSVTAISSTASSNNVAVVCNRDIISRADGQIMSLLSGTAPNRLFIVQWKKYRRSPISCAADTLNFQIKLYEGSNIVEFAYGYNKAANYIPAATVQVGLRGAANTEFINRTTTTDWTATTAGTANTATCRINNVIAPINGLTYIWTPYQSGQSPNNAQIIAPSNNATNVNINSLLQWQSNGGMPTGYRICFGTDNPPSNIENGRDIGNSTSYDPNPELTPGLTHYWKIIPYNASGDASNCPIWSFTTLSLPLPVEAISPPSGGTGIGVNTNLVWSAGLNSTSGYKVYFGTDNPPSNLVNGIQQTSTTFDHSADLASNTTFYWRIVPINSSGEAENCPIWSFTTKNQALPASNPNPANNATNVSVNSLLTWENAGYVTGYIVYLGTNNPPSNIVNGVGQNNPFIEPDLLYNTTYFWKIVPYNPEGYALDCSVWTFTTINPVQLSASSLNFGTVLPGQTSAMQQITITNSSDTDTLELQQINLEGANNTEFSVNFINSLPYILMPNQSVSLQVQSHPQTGGDKQADIRLVICNQVYSVTLLSSSDFFTAVSSGLPSVCQNSLNWGDVDSDGDLDILLAGYSNGNYAGLFHNNGNGNFSTTSSGIPGTNNAASAWGDYDNDGDLDLLLTGDASSWMSRVYRNNGNGTYTDINAGLPVSCYGAVAWGDYDNDGDLDILLTGYAGSNPSIETARIYRNNGNNTFTDINAGLTGVARSTAAWGDYDRDGDLDILLTGETASDAYISIVYRNDNNGVFTDINAGLQGIFYGSAAWGDYDNDGYLDIALMGEYYSDSWNRVTKIYHNNGYGLFTDISAALPNVYGGNISWGDFNNDGKLDVFLTGYNGSNGYFSGVYRNDGCNTFTDINAGFMGFRDGSAAVADYDNDGDLDILSAGCYNSSANYVTKLYRNNMNATNQVPTAPEVIFSYSGGLCFQAGISNDDTTPFDALTYNFRIGTTSGGCQIVSPMSNASGRRKLAAYGNTLHEYVLEFAPNTTIDLYAAAQAMDNNFAGSGFGSEMHVTSITPALQIFYPNGGENLVSGTTSYIRWANNSVLSLNLKLSPNNGTSWIDITAQAVPSAPGLYYYTVPSLNSTQCLMKILWAKDGSYMDISDGVFTVSNTSNQPLMQVIYPTAGITTVPGRNLSITWATQNVSEISLDYSIDNGVHWNVITEALAISPASYTWNVPDSVSNQVRIRIRKADAPTYCNLSGLFTICSLHLNTPNGGETIQTDYSGQSVYDISWSAAYINNINLYYSVGEIDNWQYITTTTGLSYYRWIIPAIENNQVRIKIQHSSITDIFDVSDSSFSLQIPVWFTNVNGGGFLNNYTSPVLRWRIQNISPSTSVFIEFSPNLSSWTRLNSTAIPLGDLTNTVWLNAGTATQIWFRLIQNGNNRVIARSANPITITSKQLSIISPNGGESWIEASNQCIQWSADGCSNFNIFYTSDDGITWSSIASNVLSSQLTIPWVIPAGPSTHCRIRIVDTAYGYMNLESDQNFTIIPFSVINPEVSFTADITSGEIPLTVQFSETINPGTGVISYRMWDFGDNTASNQSNPTHTYTLAGSYSVSLTVTNTYGGTTTFTRSNLITATPNYPRAQLKSSSVMDFGTVYLGSVSPLQYAIIKNVGTAQLNLNGATYIQPGTRFSTPGVSFPISVAVGDSAFIPIVFTPQSNSAVNDSIRIFNNSLNLPVLHIKLIGRGQYVPPETPTDITLEMSGDNAVITWNPVTATIYGSPITPDRYLVLYNELVNDEEHFWYLGSTTGLTYTHSEVGLFRSSMFYRVVAVKFYRDEQDTLLKGLDRKRSDGDELSWEEVKLLLKE